MGTGTSLRRTWVIDLVGTGTSLRGTWGTEGPGGGRGTTLMGTWGQRCPPGGVVAGQGQLRGELKGGQEHLLWGPGRDKDIPLRDL